MLFFFSLFKSACSLLYIPFHKIQSITVIRCCSTMTMWRHAALLGEHILDVLMSVVLASDIDFDAI
jgi:hypothetical protein